MDVQAVLPETGKEFTDLHEEPQVVTERELGVQVEAFPQVEGKPTCSCTAVSTERSRV